MLDFTRYEFGYSWYVTSPYVVPLALAAALGGLAAWRRWPRWVGIMAGVATVWSVAGLFVTHLVLGLGSPLDLPTPRFLSSGSGRVLDAGAGSGRAAIGVLLARPAATVVGLDIYEAGWGIEGNTPDRFMANARIAGIADRAEARTGDMRRMPFGDGEFDAVISSYAIDHLRRDDLASALSETRRVLRPDGEFLVLVVNPDWMAVFSPILAHHPRPDPTAWRARLEQFGFAVEEEGTKPLTLYFLARKRG